MNQIRVGVIGCGQAAQIMHLPSLRQLSSHFIVSAVADVSGTVVEAVGERFGAAIRSTDWRDIISDDRVDAVLVAGPNAYHAEMALAALAEGKHVMIEKPMCLRLNEADALVAAQQSTGRVVQIGYMRRYAAAFHEACRAVAEMGPIRLVRVRNVLGLNELVGDQVADVVRPLDLPPDVLRRPVEDQDRQLAEELGDDATAEDRHTYFFLLSLNTHDFSAMRELIGMPQRVIYAARRNGRVSPYLTAAFDYGTFICHFEAGFDELPRVEQDLQIYGDSLVLNLAYDTSFVRSLPVRLTLTEAIGKTGTTQRVVIPSWEDPFVSEWKAFHASVAEGAPVNATPADARLDVLLCADVARAIRTCAQRSRGLTDDARR